jgi:hypothetical protein
MALKRRQMASAKALYEALGIAREDRVGRDAQFERNFHFFEAPVALVVTIGHDLGSGCYMDLGMALYGLMLAAQAHGLSTCAIGAMASYPSLIRRHLSLDSTSKIVCGIALGYADPEAAVNQTRTARHLADATASLFGDLRFTRWVRGGLSWRLGVNAGDVTFDNGAAEALDAQTARTAGSFARFNASASVLQAITGQDTLYLLLSGQAATGNLDSSRKQVVGGPYSVRAYNSGTLSGDDGVQVTLEWRRALALPLPGSWQGFGFIDSATLIVNEDQWKSLV